MNIEKYKKIDHLKNTDVSIESNDNVFNVNRGVNSLNGKTVFTISSSEFKAKITRSSKNLVIRWFVNLENDRFLANKQKKMTKQRYIKRNKNSSLYYDLESKGYLIHNLPNNEHLKFRNNFYSYYHERGLGRISTQSYDDDIIIVIYKNKDQEISRLIRALNKLKEQNKENNDKKIR